VALCDPVACAVAGASRYPTTIGALYPRLGEACLIRNVGLWADGTHRCNLVLATVSGAKDSWAVATDEPPTLQTLWQYALRFQIEELFLDSKSGAFELTVQATPDSLERLYLVAAVALLYATTQGMAAGRWRQQVDPTGDVA